LSGAQAFYDAAVVPSAQTLLLTTVGSSSCPTVPVAVHVESRTSVIVTVRNDYRGTCTLDAAQTTTLVRIASSELELSGLLHIAVRLGSDSQHVPVRVLAALPSAFLSP
jgi:hypothetical protein